MATTATLVIVTVVSGVHRTARQVGASQEFKVALQGSYRRDDQLGNDSDKGECQADHGATPPDRATRS